MSRYLNNLDVEVGKSGGEVYWYWYHHSTDDAYEDIAANPITLADVRIGLNG
jgi:hypothetical protein